MRNKNSVVKADLYIAAEDSYNSQKQTSNALILPASSKKSKNNLSQSDKFDARGRLKTANLKQQILSKKKLKLRERMKEKRNKNANRAEILEKLKQYQIEAEELANMISVAKMHKQQNKQKKLCSSIAGINKKKQNSAAESSKKVWHTGPYFETDSSSSDSDSEIEAKPELKNCPDDPISMDASSMSQPENAIEVLDVILTDSKIDAASNLDAEIKVKEEPESNMQDRSLEKRPKTGEHMNGEVEEERKPAVYVPVFREKGVQAERMKLPIFAEEQTIVEAVNENSVVIICGETGSGKTTQVPQFLYEAGYTKNSRLIGITEPRRVAAISMSQRVAKEMNLAPDVVSYQIRYEGNVTERTEVKFMTDGVLMKELQKDIQLSKYSVFLIVFDIYKVIVIDEAHERSMYSDILIGLLSRIVPMRQKKGNPLKLIVMSATLRVEDFTPPHLFREPPRVLQVESRQYPVTVYYNRRTPGRNYLAEAYKKVCKIHNRLPEGGILVFVSGQREVHTLISWLKRAFPMKQGGGRVAESSGEVGEKVAEEERIRTEKKERKRLKKKAKKRGLKSVEDIRLDAYDIHEKQEAPVPDSGEKESSGDKSVADRVEIATDLNEIGVAGDLEIFDDLDSEFPEDLLDFEMVENRQPLYCLPLYSLLPTTKQSRVFSPPPDGTRLCVVATNVAETSLTIPNVKYVVDCGKEKVRLFDPITGVSRFCVQWTSKASANQRAGRAGRTGPGHCYRLFSSAVFNTQFKDFSTPDIMNKPVDDLVLQMKAMNIVKVKNFPFLTAPDKDALDAAENRLVALGALEWSKRNCAGTETEQQQARITQLGRTISVFPVKPQYGKILALCNQHGLLPYAVCLVAALSVREPLLNLVNFEGKEGEREKMLRYLRVRRNWAGKGHSLLLGDLSILLKAVGGGEFEGTTPDFCEENGLRYKAMLEIRKLRKQLTNLINARCELKDEEESLVLDVKMPPPSDQQCKLLRQIVLAGLAENVAKKTDGPGEEKGAYAAQGMKDRVFIHPTSVLYRQEPGWVVYQEIIEGAKKKYLQTICAVEPEWLAIFAEGYCSFGQKVASGECLYCPEKDEILVKVECRFGPAGWALPLAQRKHAMVAFLEGKVFRKLVKLRKKLLVSPETILKSWAHLEPRTQEILNALVERDGYSRRRMEEIWKEDTEFLLKEYCNWMPESLENRIRSMWPPVRTVKI